MVRRVCTRSLTALTTAILAVLLFAMGTTAQDQNPAGLKFPKIQLPARARGRAAVGALTHYLPQLAAWYGKSADELAGIFLSDNTLWTDTHGRLFYGCEFGMAPPANAPGAESTGAVLESPFPDDQTFLLHSRPGATKVIYLDFDGNVTSGTQWNSQFSGGADIVSEPFDLDGIPSSFDTMERQRIQYIWQRVAEDYAPFEVDVTTQDPGVDALRNAPDDYYGTRVVISPTSWYPANAGGVAYVGSFNGNNTDTPCFIFTEQLGPNVEKYIAEAASHEAGHTLGLHHDGLTSGVDPYTGSSEYYSGQGDWAPIMGVGYYREVSQWSKGEYANANRLEDDLVVMQWYGISYRVDDHGNTIGTATALTGPDIIASGIIEKRGDVDMFSFQTGEGTISFTVNPAPRGPNLDISLALYDGTGNPVPYNLDGAGLRATLTATVATGTYYLAIDGVGSGDPLTTGYSDYASLGQYQITGTVIPTAAQPVVNASATPNSGTAPLAVAFSSAGSSAADPAGSIASYYWDFNDGTNSSLPDPTHTYAAGTYTATLVVKDNNGLSSSKIVAITANQAPVAKATASPASGYTPLAVGFSSAGSYDSDGSIQSYSWDFGDGTNSTSPTPSHTYNTPATYVAVLTVMDNKGAQGTRSVTISAQQDPAKLPDLIVSSATASASSAAPGASITVSDTTKNQGTSLSASVSTTSIYLSVDSVWNAGDTLIGGRSVDVLSNGSSSAGSTPVTIPANETPGARYLIVRADAGQTVAETVETNNTKSIAITIALPDLQVSALSAPSSAVPGSAMTVTDTTKNFGTVAAAASTTFVYYSLDSILDSGDTLLGSRSAGALGSLISGAGSTPVTIPANATLGTRYLIAVADGGQAVAETVETNNTNSIAITIALPDLQVSALSAPSSAAPGSAITVTDTTKNYGTAAAAASSTFVYYSLDSILDSGDALIGNHSAGALGSSISSAGSTPVTIPANAALGTGYLIAVADGGQAVAETVETNNTKSIAITIALPDLQVSALSAPSSAVPGSAMTVTDTTKNFGTVAAAASTTFVYYSLDSILDSGDTLIGNRSVGALASGSNSAGSTQATIPANATAGTRYLIAVADGGQTMAETIETNNTKNIAITIVLPDLQVSALSAPSSAVPGSAITVTDTTNNFGTVTAAASQTSVYYSLDSILDSGDTLLGNRSVAALGVSGSSAGSTQATIPANATAGTRYLIAVADGGQTVAETIETNNTKSLAITIVLPDLQVSALSAPASALPGSAITVTDTTKNFGTVAAAASTTFVYLSLDSTLDSGDTLLGNRSAGALGSLISSAGSTSVTIPANAALGTWYLIAVADGGQNVGEAIETNNTKSIAITIALPDLQVPALSAPSSALPGSAITVTDTTQNFAPVPAGASKTFVYFSLDSVLDSGDTLLGNRSVGALVASGSSAGSTPVTIPASALPGIRYLIALADGGQTVGEAIETNNTRTTSITIGPDLQVPALSAPSSALPGSTITVTDTTQNFATVPGAASTTLVYFSLDSVLDPGDTLIGNRSVGALAASGSSAGSTPVTIPGGALPGIRYLIAVADGGQTVGESIETNNTRSTSIAIGPDLQVSALSAPSNAAPGSAITVTNTTQNFATVPAAASTTLVYFSVDNILDSGDPLIGNRSVGTLAGSGSSAGSTQVTIPADAALGTGYLIALADGGQTVGESIETNNTKSIAITITLPDLQVSALSAPSNAAPGSAIAVTDTTQNFGAVPAAASTTFVYFSFDSVLDSGDTFLGARSVGALGPSGSSAGSTQVTIPADAAPGTRYLIALADGGQTVASSIETNNTRTTSITIGPDLQVSALSVPSGAAPGSVITVTDTTQNFATAPAAASTTFVYFSLDSVLDSGDMPLGTRSVGALGASGSSAGPTQVTIPADAPLGTGYLIALADGGQAVGEWIETNNTRTVSIAILGPDLQVSALSAATSAAPGSAITVTDTTLNYATVPAAASTTLFYLSLDSVLDSGDTLLLGNRSVGPLGPSGSSAGSTQVTIPANATPGIRYLIALADGGQTVREANEGNNTRASSRSITILGPDLYVSSFSGTSSAAAGSTIIVTDTTKNAGSTPAAASTINYYLSIDTIYGTGDILIGSRGIGPLLNGASNTGSPTLTDTAVRIPAVAPARYYIIARADGGNVVAETNETNNNKYYRITVQ